MQFYLVVLANAILTIACANPRRSNSRSASLQTASLQTATVRRAKELSPLRAIEPFRGKFRKFQFLTLVLLGFS